MASRRLLIHTVDLFNYMGEIEDEATYQKTVIRHCYCPRSKGVVNQGQSANDQAILFIFDCGTIAEDECGNPRTFLPYAEWERAEDKSPYWTISDEGDDFFRVAGSPEKFRITDFSHKQTGSRRMWHFEVNAK